MKEVLVIYHSRDIDGIISGGMASELERVLCEFMPYHYNEPYDLSYILKHRRVYIVDVMLPEPAMLALAEGTELVWFDHHASAFEFYNSNLPAFSRARVYFPKPEDLGKYSCTDVIFKYVVGSYPRRYSHTFHYMIGRYDIFDKSDIVAWEEEIVPLQRFLNSILSTPEDYLELQERLERNLWEYVEIGRLMYKKEKNQARALYPKLYTCQWQGFKCLVSEVGKRVLDTYTLDFPYSDYDIIATQTQTEAGFAIGIYNYPGKSYNLSEIARQFGGGGHRDAAGFTSKAIVFQK